MRLMSAPAAMRRARGVGSGCRRLGAAFAIASVAALAVPPEFAVLEQMLMTHFGRARVSVLREWKATVDAARSGQEAEKVRSINDFFNRTLRFGDDETVWSQSDYWATPLESIGQGRGDCEDFAIAKYFSLKAAGIPLSKLRLVYVKAMLTGADGPYLQAHMVLAYYPSPTAEPQVLDNLVGEIRSASQRPDLQPVFSFNSEGIWAGADGSRGSSSRGQLSRWQDLLKRAAAEGFE